MKNLINGMPVVGLGFWKVDQQAAPNVVADAIDSGYRHFDCACDYGNEAGVGKGLEAAIQSGKVDRDDLWVTSKLWNTYHAAEHVQPALEKTLEDLRLDYVDLYLIHFPVSTRFVPFDVRYPPEWFFDPDAENPKMEQVNVSIRETWEAMEQIHQQGLAKNIGVSNFNCQLLREMLSWETTKPSVLQVELHPRLTQEKLLRFCNENDILVTGFSPLGAESYFSIGMAEEGESLLSHATIQKIAADVGRTPAQILLRWGVQRGVAVVPKTSDPNRMAENISVFDFELTPEAMQEVSALNQNRRFNDPGDFCESAFNTFFPIYE